MTFQELLIIVIIGTIISILVPYIIYRIWLYFTFKEEKERVGIKRRKKTLLLTKIEEELSKIKKEKYARKAETPEQQVIKIPMPKTVNEVAILAKAIKKIVFTEKDFPINEITVLRRLGLIKTYGKHYVVTKDTFQIVRNLVNMMKEALEYNFSDLDWELFENGIRALGVVYFHERKGPILVPISDHFNLLQKIRISPVDIAMLDTDKIVIGENTFIIQHVKLTERRPTTHTIIAETVSEELSRNYIKRKSLEFINIARQKLGEQK